ncbi:MAG: translation initiation factor IF-2 subunit beta [Nanoarchaeota archaeon]|nr:translation initiation factor IF-2 subunit beta [Nanoarchaeota archaeon]MBU1030611.1 translation initiation factor IF-2 subunit beta [Nanoarchaeota archaeon]MBU1849737.1 translation initiation factor IF-2 subunit beta [Nanoarchaeota archaeon]
MKYEDMLKSAQDKLPKINDNIERFNIPKVKGQVQGNKTIIGNFLQIANTLRRKPEHLLKYVLKELATPGEIKNSFLIFGTKLPASKINEKIQSYAETFVLCKICGKPDTKLTKESSIYYLKCHACGAKYSIYSKI